MKVSGEEKRMTIVSPLSSFMLVICSFSVASALINEQHFYRGENVTLNDDVTQTNTQANLKKRRFFSPLLVTLLVSSLAGEESRHVFQIKKSFSTGVCYTVCLSRSAAQHSNLCITVYLHSCSTTEGHISRI